MDQRLCHHCLAEQPVGCPLYTSMDLNWMVIFTWQVTLITCFLRLKTNYSFLCFVRICSFFWVNTNSMFADLYIFYCGACDYSLSLFLRGGWVCGRGRGYQTPCLSVKEHKSLYVDRWICIQVCQGFDKETLLGHNRSVPKTTIKLLAAPNLSRELFLPGLFIVEVMFVQRSRVSVMSSDFILLILWDLICHNPHRPAPRQVLTGYVLYVRAYINTRALARCALRPVVSSQHGKEVPSCESRHRPTPLYRCEYILCITAVSGLFLRCTVLVFFSKHVWVSVFPHPCHGRSEPHKAFSA